MILPNKTSIRQQIRQHRRELSRARQAYAAQSVCLRIMRSHWWKAAKQLAFYWPADGEVSVLPLLRKSLKRGKRCYLPVVEHNQLLFREFRAGIALRRNRYGIPEPRGTAICPVQKLDVILLPLVAFDEKCNRLGMGAGFYDRTLASKTSPLRIGVAHQFQKVAELPIDPWDVPLHAIVTDTRIYRRI